MGPARLPPGVYIHPAPPPGRYFLVGPAKPYNTSPSFVTNLPTPNIAMNTLPTSHSGHTRPSCELISSHKDLVHTLSWLHSLCKFCDELRELATVVPVDADGDQWTTIPEFVSSRPDSFPMLLTSGHPFVQTYQHDLPADLCAPVITTLHHKACVAYRALCAHPVLGKFRPDKDPLFYEKVLSICMSVGIQHLQTLPAMKDCHEEQADVGVEWPFSLRMSDEGIPGPRTDCPLCPTLCAPCACDQ